MTNRRETRPVTRNLFLTTIAVCIGANFAAVMYFQTILNKLVPLARAEPVVAQLGLLDILQVLVVSVVLPFGVPTLFLALYMVPLDQAIRRGKTGPGELSATAIRRFQNYPLVCALIGMAGWYVAYVGSIVSDPRYSDALGGFFLEFSGAAALTFVFIYFLLEVLNRKLYLTVLFPRGVPTSTPGVYRVSVRSRFLLFAFAVSGFPLLLLAGSLAFGMGTNPLAETGLWFIATFLPVALGLTLLVAQFYQTPLVEMKAAVEEIRRENYEVQVPVTSGDEVGHLGEGINTMAVELRDKGFIKDTFGKTVDPAVRDHLLAGHLDLGGSLKPAAILFSDLRDFTAISESLPPAVVVPILNRYFERMSTVVSAHGGFVNKFMGDAILALFNLPLPRDDYGASALKAALAMQVELEALNREFEAEGLPALRMGIGLHAGEVMAGNIGSPQRMEYTVIGDPVNTASRLESLTKEFGVPLLVSRELVELLPPLTRGSLASAGQATVKGKVHEVEVFTAAPSQRS